MCDRPGAGLVPVINRFGVGWKETAAAASKRPNVLQPRDHQAALSLYRDRGEKWGIAQIGREEGLVRPPARVTDPAVVYSYCTGNRWTMRESFFIEYLGGRGNAMSRRTRGKGED